MDRGLENERVGDGYYMRRRETDDGIVIGTASGPVELPDNIEAFALDLLAMLPAFEVARIVERALLDKYGDGPDPLYVCVNKLQKLPAIRGEKFYVLGDDGCAYREPLDIADVHLNQVDEFDHNLSTAPVYRLVPVPRDEVDGWIAEASKER